MRSLVLVLVPAVLGACASDRAALERIDESLARIEERLGAMEDRAAAAPQVPLPTIWFPSAWPLLRHEAVQVPTVFPLPADRILAEGGCVLPGRPWIASRQPLLRVELPLVPSPSAEPPVAEPGEPERR